MNEEEVKKLLDEKVAEVTASFEEKLKEKEGQLNNVVEELKSVKKTKQEIEAERDLLKSKPKEGDPQLDINNLIDARLNEEKQKSLEKVKTTAKESFKEAHKELFHESNDPGGLKWSAFEQKLKRLNLEGLETEKELKEAFEDALVILRKPTDKSDSIPNPFAATPPPAGKPPVSVEQNGLDTYEKKLIESMGWDEERYLKIKKARPHYVAHLLKTSRGE